MPFYIYRAVDIQGKIHEGRAFSVNHSELYQFLKSSGLRLVGYRKIHPHRFNFYLRKPSVPTPALIDVCLHLKELDRAGLPLVDSINELAKTISNSRLQAILHQVHEDLEKGLLLSQALKHHPLVFDSSFVSLIAVGEKTGRFYPIFEQLENYLRWCEEIKQQARKSLRYPAVLVTILGLLTVILISIVLPNIESFLSMLGINDLPLTTKALIAVTHFFANYGFLGVSVVGGILFLWVSLIRVIPLVKMVSARLLIHIPWLGNIFKGLDLCRFLQCFAVMIGSGIEILPALNQANGVLTNQWLKQKMLSISQDVAKGMTLSQAFLVTGLFSSFIVRLVSLGEETGKLSELLLTASDHHLKDIMRQVKNVTSWVEPSLIIIMGAFLVWIVLAVMLPIYDNLTVFDF